MNQENELDDLFKKRLEDPVDNESYNEADWNSLEQMLDKRKKRRGLVYWLPLYGSAAALLLLFFGYMVFRPKTTATKPPVNEHAVVPQNAHSGKSDGSIRQQTDQTPKASNPVTLAKISTSGKDGANNKPFLRSSADGTHRNAGPVKQEFASQTDSRSTELLTSAGTSYTLGSTRIADEPVYAVKLPGIVPAIRAPEAKNTVRIKRPDGYRPQFTLSVMAAPDINGVGSFQQSKVGTNEGLLFSVGLSHKFTVSTGAIYSIKPYITGFENYHTPYQFPTDPIDVTADCRMLDIPINIGYTVYNKHRNSIAIGTGLSSYLMLHESYKFNYANTYITGPSQFTVPNSDGYYFSIINLNATFQHQVNSKVGFTLQPYLKLPLTSVGYSQVRLQTTGVALGLTWNLNASSKP